MAEALKTFFSPALVKRLAAEVARANAHFPSLAFIKDATAGLDELELLDPRRHIRGLSPAREESASHAAPARDEVSAQSGYSSRPRPAALTEVVLKLIVTQR